MAACGLKATPGSSYQLDRLSADNQFSAVTAPAGSASSITTVDLVGDAIGGVWFGVSISHRYTQFAGSLTLTHVAPMAFTTIRPLSACLKSA